MFLYAKPTIAATQVKSDCAVEITREIDDLLREREEIENIIGFPIDEDTLCANLKRYIEDEQSASYDVGFEDGQNEGYESGYDDAKNEMED